MDIGKFDLNLLVAFDAMLRHQNVTRAGQAVGMSQPAMSAAIARLRGLFNDPLFVRTGRGMTPTPLALQLGGPVTQVLGTVQTQIMMQSVFDPATTRRRFAISIPDVAEMMTLPRLLKRLRREAPHADLDSIVLPPKAMLEGLESGAIDVAMGYFPDLAVAGMYQQRLVQISYVCMVRENHPVIGERMTLEDFLGASHAVVHPPGRSEELIERFLEKKRLRRRVLLNLSSLISLPMIIAETDLVAIVTRTAGTYFRRLAKVRLVEAPLRLPVNDVKQYWHRRFHRDPANIWLRGVVRDAMTRGD